MVKSTQSTSFSPCVMVKSQPIHTYSRVRYLNLSYFPCLRVQPQLFSQVWCFNIQIPPWRHPSHRSRSGPAARPISPRCPSAGVPGWSGPGHPTVPGARATATGSGPARWCCGAGCEGQTWRRVGVTGEI